MNRLEELEGRNARENTGLLMRSIKNLVEEAEAKGPFTQQPRRLPDVAASGAPTALRRPLVQDPVGRPSRSARDLPALAAPEPAPASPKKSLFGRLFGE